MQTTKVLREKVIDCSKIRKMLIDGPTDRTTYFWRVVGLKNRTTGKRVTLEWAYCGKTVVTSEEALERFLEALNADH